MKHVHIPTLQRLRERANYVFSQWHKAEEMMIGSD